VARRLGRFGGAELEPHYRAQLEAERARWWNESNFETWRRLYVSEYPRGFFIIDTLRTYVPEFSVEGARVLDIGCGDAGALIAFAEEGARVSGIEPSSASFERARTRAEEHGVDVDLRAGAAEKLPFEDASFDLVILDNVLEHVSDQRQTLAEIHRVLRADGLLYMVTPKPLALRSIWNDPHYDLAGLVLLPRALQKWYFEVVRGGGAGGYDVGHIPTRWKLRRLLRGAAFRLLVSPRELWMHYLRDRIADPEEIRAGPMRSLARRVNRLAWAFSNPVARWLLDIAVGSNFMIARRVSR
jgi:2-polyprenyl-3-methyl-5-hydroxy-6-metoxy-1,4-benzoquinol methylase